MRFQAHTGGARARAEQKDLLDVALVGQRTWY